MRITYLKTIGFRKFAEDFETKLYDVTNITGGNRKGKTNILHAIIWAFLGTNLTGDDKVWVGNRDVENCYVELDFIDNNNNTHKLIRGKNRFNSKKNILTLDDEDIGQEDLQSFYLDKKLFLSIMNPNYFISKNPADQKKMLDSYLPQINMDLVYEKLDSEEKKYLEGVPKNITDLIKDLKASSDLANKKIENLKGKIDYASSVTDAQVNDKIIFTRDNELLLLRQELSYLMAENIQEAQDKQQKIVDNLSKQIEQTEKQISNYYTELETGKKAYLLIKNESISYCPMCEQKIENESKVSTIRNMKNDLEKTFEAKNDLENTLLNLKSSFVQERCKLHSLESKQNENSKQKIEEIQTQISTIEEEKINTEKFNSSIELQIRTIQNAKSDIEIFNKQIKEQKNLIDDISKAKKVAQKLYINYIEDKMQYATKHLKDVKIRYYSVLKDGEIKDDFIITYKNGELKTLSRSETIATSLELCNMFNKISNVNLPLFVDDYESCADYDFIQDYSKDTQILVANVEKGTELNIQDNNLKEANLLQVA